MRKHGTAAHARRVLVARTICTAIMQARSLRYYKEWQARQWVARRRTVQQSVARMAR